MFRFGCLTVSAAMFLALSAAQPRAYAQDAAAPAETPAAQAPAPATAAQTDSHAQAGQAPKAKTDDRGDKDKSADNDKPVDLSTLHHPSLWHDPGNIASLDLLSGPGGKDGMPKPPFKFLEEDMNGTNPKFDADDANGQKWRVKVGPEARPEVVATRLLWAMGYYINDDYVLDSADIDGLRMKRGGNLIQGDHITDARFAHKPDGQKKIGIWEWKKNPFNGTREFNGLRVMMALMNSWDLKDVNNAVFHDKHSDEDLFLVSDIGATFATNGIVLPIAHSKGDIDSFKKSKFITKQTDTTVSFSTPSAPKGMLLETAGFAAKEFAERKGFEWIGQDIPKADARWIAGMLGQLSQQQIGDALRAGHFPDDAVAMYSILIENRIQELKGL